MKKIHLLLAETMIIVLSTYFLSIQQAISSDNFADDFVYPVAGSTKSDPDDPDVLYNRTNPNPDGGWSGNGVGQVAKGQGHLGEDYNLSGTTDEGRKVYAVANGTVVEVMNAINTYGWTCDNDHHGWGRVIVIKHEAPPGKSFITTDSIVTKNYKKPDDRCTADGCPSTENNPTVVYTLYGHLSKTDFKVTEGMSVKKGQWIARIGKQSEIPGDTTPHLHFEIKSQKGFDEGVWNKDGTHSKQKCGAQGVGSGYSWIENYAPERYKPSVFIKKNQFEYTKSSMDVIFTIDTTGSMDDDIASVKSAATSIVNGLDAAAKDYRVAVVSYEDHPISPYGSAGCGDAPYHAVHGFSDDKDTIISAIKSLSLRCGADWREAVYSALIRSIYTENLGEWRNGVKKVVIAMGDAPPHDPEPVTGYVLSDVVNAAYSVDPASIYPIVIGGDSTANAYFSTLAEETGGQAFSSPTASGVVNAVLEAIQSAAQAPIALAGGSYKGNSGFPITFNANNSYDPDGEIVSYEWDWNNDGTYDELSNSSFLEHTWSTAFSGVVRLRVTDAQGLTAVDVAPVEVVTAGDTNNDNNIDKNDYKVFLASFGSCYLYPNYVSTLDYDEDGCITFVDYQIWYKLYKNQ